jgi:hypothetical protein
LREILAGKRYAISAFSTYDYRLCYGIVSEDADPEARFTSIARVGKKSQYHLIDEAEAPRDKFGKPIRSKALDFKVGIWQRIKAHLLYGSVCFLATGILTIVTYYHQSSAKTGFERFMDSQGFGVRFMMTAVGVLLKSLWSTIDQGTFLSPFFSLCRTEHCLLFLSSSLSSARTQDFFLNLNPKANSPS